MTTFPRALPAREPDSERLANLLDERRGLRVRLAELEAEIDGILARRTAPRERPSAQQQMAYRIPAVAKLLDVSPDLVEREVKAGKLPSHLIGGARVVLAGELEKYMARLPERRDWD